MTAAQRHASWFASKEADMRVLLDRLSFEQEDVKRDFAYYLARLRYVAEVASLKIEEILQESSEPSVRTHAFLLRLLIDNLSSADREIVRMEWPRKQGGAP